MKADTPLMTQFNEMKAKHPDAILLFRIGDFYETFSQDAIDCSEILGITLTRRANGNAKSVELAGFPHHALDTYLPKLVRAGRRVAICEQLEDPKLTNRKITEMITPGQMDIPTSKEENTMLIKAFLLLLSAVQELLKPICLFQMIMSYGKEIRKISKELGISPNKAFEESKEQIVQPSLFD